MPESIQHKLDRVRRPRVQITYDVETLGSIVKTELPFVVGIMADLSGNAIPKLSDPSKPANVNPVLLKDRKYVEIDRDNFNTIMEKIEPTVKLKDGGAELTFKKLDDFDPINVLLQVQTLKDMFDSRTRLSNLVAKLDGNVGLQKEFIAAYNGLANKAPLLAYYNAVKNPTTVVDTPTPAGTIKITPAATTGVNPTTDGLVITLATVDEPKVTNLQITAITGGTLFKGTTQLKNNDTITVAEGKTGLKFTPNANVTEGSFVVTAVDAAKTPVPGIATATAKITVGKDGV